MPSQGQLKKWGKMLALPVKPTFHKNKSMGNAIFVFKFY